MTERVKTVYSGVEIVYNESDDRWDFEHNGKFRFAKTLKLAKNAIDTTPKPKKEPFEKFEAYHIGYIGNDVTTVTVTSFDGPSHAWVIKDGRRSKERIDNLYVVSDANNQLIKEVDAIEEAINGLRKKQAQKEREMTKVEPPKGE